jgi:hypothetical protein
MLYWRCRRGDFYAGQMAFPAGIRHADRIIASPERSDPLRALPLPVNARTPAHREQEGSETRCGSLAPPSDAARQITRPIPHTPAHTDTRFMAAMPETTTVTLCPKCRKPATVKTNQRGQTKMYLCLECRDIFTVSKSHATS